MSIQRYTLYLMNKDGNTGYAVVTLLASSSSDLPDILRWDGRFFVRAGSYSYSYHRAADYTLKMEEITEIRWRTKREGA